MEIMTPDRATAERPTADLVESVIAEDGVALSYRLWGPPPGEPRGLVVILHSAGYHGGPYGALAERLCPLGVAVCAPDVRGHGLSGGDRGEIVSANALVRDLAGVVDLLLDRFDDPPLFLFGDSMGALIALAYARAHPHELSGIVLAAPPLELRARQLLSKETLDAAGRAIWEPNEAVDLLGGRLDDSTADEDYKLARRNDDLALGRVGTDYVLLLACMTKDWERRYADIEAPVLVLQGEADGIVPPAAARRLYRALRTDDKHLRIFPGAHHTLLWDANTPAVLDEVIGWFERHMCGRSGS